jgi:hypothetical protein
METNLILATHPTFTVTNNVVTAATVGCLTVEGNETVEISIRADELIENPHKSVSDIARMKAKRECNCTLRGFRNVTFDDIQSLKS